VSHKLFEFSLNDEFFSLDSFFKIAIM
jgi:hypothetical protein